MDRLEHLLIVDDDPRILRLLERYLVKEGYIVSTATNGDEMRRKMAQRPVDLVVLDLVLPGEDGLTLARSLRAVSDVGIVILTAKGETIDRIVGLEIGADDYIPKPFDNRELLARVRSVLRRRVRPEPSDTPSPQAPGPASLPEAVTSPPTEDVEAASDQASPAAAPPSAALPPEGIRFGTWCLNPESRQIRQQAPEAAPSPEEVGLTNAEFRLLLALLHRPNKVFSRDELLDLVAGRNRHPLDRSIDVLIVKLRHKIEQDPRAPTLIKTVRGVGYMLTAEVSGSLPPLPPSELDPEQE